MIQNMKIALQLYSVRDDLANDFEGTLKKVKEMGYEGVEFAGLYGKSAEEVRDLAAKVGIDPISAHVPINELADDPAGTVAKYKTIGCKFIAIPSLDEARRPGNPGFEKFLSEARAIGEECRRQGITLLYHNHDFEFAKVDGKYALDIMYDTIPADMLQTELDTCWVNVGGEDPTEYVLKYSGRAPVVHLKDFVMPGKKPSRLYELIGVENKDEKEEDEVGAFEFRPVGYGAQNFPSILDAAEKAGAGWVVVEQDRPSMDKTPMECAKMSIDYLNGLK